MQQRCTACARLNAVTLSAGAAVVGVRAQLHQVEAEAKHDVKARAGRRMLLLNQGIILLLAISCLLAALDNALKISGLPAADSSSSAVGSDLADAAGSSSSGGGGHDTGWTVDADGSRQCAYPESVSDETSVQLG